MRDPETGQTLGGPHFDVLSAADRESLAKSGASAHAEGKVWPDDPKTGALLLRAQSSDAYVRQYLSPANFAKAKSVAASMDAADEKQRAQARDWAGDMFTRPRNATISAMAGNGFQLDRIDQKTQDANMAAARQRLGAGLSDSDNPAVFALGGIYSSYDHLPHVLQGTLDSGLQTAADSLNLLGAPTRPAK